MYFTNQKVPKKRLTKPLPINKIINWEQDSLYTTEYYQQL